MSIPRINERVARRMHRSPSRNLWEAPELRTIAQILTSRDGRALFKAAALLGASPLRGFAPFIAEYASALVSDAHGRDRPCVNRAVSELLGIVACEFGYEPTGAVMSLVGTGFKRGRVYEARNPRRVTLTGYFI
jgi:hypothetical protein